MSTAQPTPHQPALDITPSKRKCSPLIYHELSDTKSQSAPNLLQGEQYTSSSLKTPDRLIPRKRAKSASGRSPRADATTGNDDTTANPHSRTPNSCTRKEDYKYKGARLNHINTCQDPDCKWRSASVRSSASNDDTRTPPKTGQQQIEDVFTTISLKNQAESIMSFLGNDAYISSKESLFSKQKRDLSVETAEATGEPHIEAPKLDEAGDLELHNLSCEPSPRYDKPNPEATQRHIRNRSPVCALDMHSKLLTEFEARLSAQDEAGYIYVLKDPRRPHLCKIGRGKHIKSRVKAIGRKCELDTELIHCEKVGLYKRTELLIHAYLSNFCQPYFCKRCRMKHGEWFEIPDELAKAAVRKWVDFMYRERPYDPISKELKPFWSLRLKYHAITSAGLDVDESKMQWDRIISPSDLDHYKHTLEPIREILWRFFWPVYATLAWTVTFIAFQHPVTFLLMTTSVFGTFISMSYDFHLLRHLSIRSKGRGA